MVVSAERPLPSGSAVAPARRSALVAGIVAPIVFVVTFTVAGALRPDYSPWSMFVSELSLGSDGWVQRVNFLVTGTLVVLFAWGTAPALRGRRRVGAVPVTLAVLGVCLALSGVADTDPSTMFTPVTTRGLVHALLGAVVFLSMPVSCLLVAVRLRRTGDRSAMRWWSAGVGAGLIALTVVLKVSEFPTSDLYAGKGLVQRLILVAFFAWLLTLALWLRRREVGDRPASAG